MKYCIVAGYVCSGSSVINDLLRETSGAIGFEHEFKLFREKDGLLDLERNVVTDWDSMKFDDPVGRFYSLCEGFVSHVSPLYSYDFTFDKDFMKHIEQFIDDITCSKILMGSSMYTLDRRTKYKVDFKNRSIIYQIGGVPYKEINFIDVTREEYCSAVSRLIDDIFASYNKNGCNMIILDHGLTPKSANRLKDFFPSGKMVIVDRDPRDTALSMIQRSKTIGMELKRNLDASLYVRWFKKTRANWREFESTDVIYMRYEDLILDYEASRKKVFDTIGLSTEKHVNQYKYFDPKISATRIGKWKNFKENFCSADEWYDFCDKVRAALPEFCYDI